LQKVAGNLRIQPLGEDKLDTVHENETGFGNVLATLYGIAHYSTETGFCNGFCRT
jgi:hypothetical protein